MTPTIPELGMSRLRKAAEAAEEATGLRAEIIRGVLMMSPTRRGRHAAIINELYAQLHPALPDHLESYQVASVSLPDDKDDYATPDLLVCDAGIPAYLLVDPRDGTWTLYTVPREGAYQGVLHGRYGEGIELPALGVKISTGGFTRYA
ncbi:Uma2 family endonuclease [Streptomyces sparsogenes]|uniref:Uncharacterized protein n=1 Tax=Streptomyces sparsogenes DSM 40356 TaxID=1331668 RepID=A0A1R1SLT8_9ACTN|nr:Uma2 family endonuclease [Streptomyces sparsogenes]OMI39256.1 hypothetical protein SPAR_12005 [Streptomyces sparsogenes DSM 40356]